MGKTTKRAADMIDEDIVTDELTMVLTDAIINSAFVEIANPSPRIESFAEAGVLTHDAGVVITLRGSQQKVYLTIQVQAF